MKILFAGYATVDLIENKPHIGGAAGIMAMNAQALGIDSSLMAPLSDDKNGKWYQGQLIKRSVDMSLSNFDSPHLPTCVITDPHGQGSTRKWKDNGANSYLEKINVDRNKLNQFDAIFLANCNPLLAEKIAIEAPHNLFYIPGPQAVLQKNYLRETIVKKSALIFANDEEAPFVWKLKPFNDSIVEYFIVTEGKKGGCIYGKDGSATRYSADSVTNIVDTTGGGDAFALGFALSYLKKEPITASSGAGIELAQRVLAQYGALLE